MTDKEKKEDWFVHERFFDLYDRMLGEVSLSDVLDHLSRVVSDVMHAEGTTVYIVREETRVLEACTLVYNVRKKITTSINASSLAGYCALSGDAFVIPDAYGDLSHVSPNLHFNKSWDKTHKFRTRDVMCAPAMFKGTIVGVVQVLNSIGEPFTEADLQAVKSTARLVGYALYHARLYDDLASMKRLQQEKAKFMSIMVHELKSPLAAAKMITDTILMKYVPSDAIEKTVEKIAGRLDGMLELIKDTLTLSRVQAGNVLGDICVVDIRETVEENAEMYKEQAEIKGLLLEVDLPDIPVNVRIDKQGLKLIVSNLISNAVKYTEKGSVKVRVGEEDGQVVFSVEDTGMGVPQKDIPNLFRGFFRASNARKSSVEGTGVGLAGVKSMIERFDGNLRLDTAEGKGSVFEVYLPALSS